MILKLLLFPTLVHAGWWSRFCERNLITDDPTQYETVSPDWVKLEVERLEIREKWNQLTEVERRHLALLRRTRALMPWQPVK
jgi:hypothetical protein